MSSGTEQPEQEGATQSARILLVEDDPGIGEVLNTGLTFLGHRVDRAETIAEAREVLAANTFDLAMLDVRLPDGSGLDLCRQIRTTSEVPVIIVSAADSLDDRLAGFDAGADDYVVKPFFQRELALRVAAILRRRQPRQEDELLSGPHGLQLDLRVGDVIAGNQRVRLTRSESGILGSLLRARGAPVSAETLSQRVWRYDSVDDANFVQQHVSRLRRKLQQLGLPRGVIRTIYGIGYAIEDASAEPAPSE